MTKYQAYDRFWNSFGIPAYDQLTVPQEIFDEATQKMIPLRPPYLTYEGAFDDFGNELALTASLWYRSDSWSEITAKADEIGERIGRGGEKVKYDGGTFEIQKRKPFMQRMDDPDDDTIRRVILQYSIEYQD